MDKPRGYNAKRKKPGAEGQVLFDFTYMTCMQSSYSHRDRRYNGGCQGLWRGGNRELLFSGFRISAAKDKKVLEEGGDGYTWANVLNGIELHT